MNSKNSVLIKQIKHDISMGIFHSWKKYILVIFIFATACAFFESGIIHNITYGCIKCRPSLADYLVEIFKGMKVYDITNKSPSNSFEIPVIWLMINLYLTYIVGSYPLNDLYGYGQQVLVHSKSRCQWWLSKCIWNICSVLVFYLIGYLVIFIFSLCTGDISFTLNHDINLLVSQVNTSKFKSADVFLVTVLLPIFTSVALCLLQMVVAFLSRPIFGCIVVICILVASAYNCLPFLIGNYLMILRNSVVIPNGVSTVVGISAGILLSVFSIIAGNIWFKKFDILDKA